MTEKVDIVDLVNQADRAGAESVEDLNMFDPLQVTNKVNPLAMKVVNELGDDAILAEYCLHMIRQKKQALLQAQLIALYGQEWWNQKVAEMQESNQETTDSSG